MFDLHGLVSINGKWIAEQQVQDAGRLNEAEAIADMSSLLRFPFGCLYG